MNKITFIPVGGLANRMRALAAAVSLSRAVGSHLHVIWFRDWALGCPFRELFEPLPEYGISLKEATFTDLLLYDRPRERNFKFPQWFQRMKFDHCIYERSVSRLYRDKFDFESWARKKNVYIASYTCFYDSPGAIYQELFHPVESIRMEVERRCRDFSAYTVGIHIRRTDNIDSINESPIELFVESIEKEIKMHEDVRFYLATDSEADKELLYRQFGNRILTSDQVVSRGSIEGMKEAMADLYTLSQTDRIYGSSQSSFSVMASWIGGKECIVLKK